MNKKLFSTALSLALTFSLAAPAFAANEKEVVKDQKGMPVFVSGQLTEASSMSPKDIVLDYFNGNKYKQKENKQDDFAKNVLGLQPMARSFAVNSLTEEANLNESQETFVVKSQGKDDLGYTYIRLQQVYNGVPVFGYDQVANVNADGIITSVSGPIMPELDAKAGLKQGTNLTGDASIQIAQADLGLEGLDYVTDPSSELVVYVDGDDANYAYKVNLNYLAEEPGNWDYFVNAADGTIINKYNKLSNSASVGTGKMLDGSNVNVNTYLYNGTYYLYDVTRDGAPIITYDANNSSSRWSLPGNYITDRNNNFTSTRDQAAVDAHINSGRVADYYKNKFNRNSFDGNGALIKSTVHFGTDYNNAFWNGSQLVYGDGDGHVFTPLSGALDVVAHELTHAVTTHTADLTYQNESGAINEAVSDIFGAAVEFEFDSNPNWLIGEDITGPGLGNPALRSMSDPGSFGDPDHYTNRYTGTQDNGGVHINSNIINKAAQLMAAGGTHYGVTVNGFGVEKMEKIWYRALTQHMTSSTNFSQLRPAIIQSARELYGNGSEIQTINDAFDAIGVK